MAATDFLKIDQLIEQFPRAGRQGEPKLVV